RGGVRRSWEVRAAVAVALVTGQGHVLHGDRELLLVVVRPHVRGRVPADLECRIADRADLRAAGDVRTTRGRHARDLDDGRGGGRLPVRGVQAHAGVVGDEELVVERARIGARELERGP